MEHFGKLNRSSLTLELAGKTKKWTHQSIPIERTNERTNKHNKQREFSSKWKRRERERKKRKNEKTNNCKCCITWTWMWILNSLYVRQQKHCHEKKQQQKARKRQEFRKQMCTSAKAIHAQRYQVLVTAFSKLCAIVWSQAENALNDLRFARKGGANAKWW